MNTTANPAKDAKSAKNSHALVIVDPQNDFCDPQGSLFLKGAEDDMLRLAEYIERDPCAISQIYLSLDSHDRVAVFHPLFWVDEAGNLPAPFTQISHEDFVSSKWKVSSEANHPYVSKTLALMDARGIGSVMIWPEHCVVSTWGHQIVAPLQKALAVWQDATNVAVRYVFKGENPYTDQYSIFEGVDSSYMETAFNQTLFDRLSGFERITFAGEALTHCVMESVLSYTRRLGTFKQELHLLTNCTSPVGGFSASDALDTLSDAGVQMSVSTDPA